MESLVMLAAALPFVVIVLGVVALASVRCSMTPTRLQVRVLGFTVRDIGLDEITSVDYVPAEQARGLGLLHRGGMVVIGVDGKTVAISPRDAEGFYVRLKGRVKELTGRDV